MLKFKISTLKLMFFITKNCLRHIFTLTELFIWDPVASLSLVVEKQHMKANVQL